MSNYGSNYGHGVQIPSEREISSKVRSLQTRYNTTAPRVQQYNQEVAQTQRDLAYNRPRLESEMRMSTTSLSRQTQRNQLQNTITGLENRQRELQSNPPRAAIRTLDRIEGDRRAVETYRQHQYTFNKKAPQEVADQIAAYGYRSRFPARDDDR